MIVTIDGPAGAGKSSAARQLAAKLGFQYLDTGAMYRAVALLALRQKVDPANVSAVANLLPSLTLDMPPGKVLLQGEDVSEAIRSTDVTAHTGMVADNAAVRARLAQLQREIASGRDIVCEGRDQGTVVFPQAECKFFLSADPTERARRRQAEMMARGQVVTVEEILAAQDERDARDATRELAPMVPAEDAQVLDSTALTLDEVVQQMEEQVRQRMKQT